MRCRTEKLPDGGIRFIDIESGEEVGVLRGSVGLWGESTGDFRGCRTTTPLNELGITEVDGKPVKPWQ